MRILVLLVYILILPVNVFCFQLKNPEKSRFLKSVNLILVGINQPSQQIFLQDAAEIKQKLEVIKPFDEFKDLVNVSYLTLENNEENVSFKRNNGIPPIAVRVDLLNNLTRQVGKYKLIIIDYQGSSSCAELSVIDKTSLVIVGRAKYVKTEDFLKGFLHELGHSIGLRDECINCPQVEPGFPNCAPTKELAKEWWGGLMSQNNNVDFIIGCCGSKNNFRPSIASLMNDTNKAATYGFVNEDYLRKELTRYRSGSQ